jgi:hypothetical protein
MPQAVIGGFLIVHGLITTMIGFGAVTNPSASPMALPAWFAWWPGPFGRLWVFEAMNLGGGFQMLGGLVWLAAGLALLGGGIGWLGVAPLEGVRYPLLVGGAASASWPWRSTSTRSTWRRCSSTSPSSHCCGAG